jgi:hypothetical protein
MLSHIRMGGSVKRRSVMLGGIDMALLAGRARGTNVILGTSPLGPIRRAFVNQPTIVRQQCPEWCWAASASMIFAMHGHPVNQQDIVGRVFGGLACMVGQGIIISAVLSGTWIDQHQQPFQAQFAAAYDFGAGIIAITNAIILNELTNDRPLLYGNSHHAMVVGQFEYIDTPMGPKPESIGVFGPWPASPPFHPLSPLEMLGQHEGGQMGYLAAVHV